VTLFDKGSAKSNAMKPKKVPSMPSPSGKFSLQKFQNHIFAEEATRLFLRNLLD
jgi:hypothetical protein